MLSLRPALDALYFKISTSLFLVMTTCHPVHDMEPRIGNELYQKNWKSAPIIAVGSIKNVKFGEPFKLKRVDFDNAYADLALEELEVDIEEVIKGDISEASPIITYRWRQFEGFVRNYRPFDFYKDYQNKKFIQDRRIFYLLPFKNQYRMFCDYSECSYQILSGKPEAILGESAGEQIVNILLYPGSGYDEEKYLKSIGNNLYLAQSMVGTRKRIEIFEEFLKSSLPGLYKAVACVTFLRFPEVISHPCMDEYVAGNTHPLIQERLQELSTKESHIQQFRNNPQHWLLTNFFMEEDAETQFDPPENTMRFVIERNIQWTQDPSIKKQLQLFLTDLAGYREKAFQNSRRLNEERNQKTR